ncbi:hypothetical protein K443DRAFT_680974 [Laccaria amethystina LaAM-08-1]|uniref:PBP domain-containing protein n=1 Tax=Laccaria amethystina LaAM-08-1 TaxID=1095629 RepID=A0A0C9XQ98_9AGAR|nr:hypothetical protein K443DRAFT_680974 [Laccaria amethystina LaAM-08-1]
MSHHHGSSSDHHHHCHTPKIHHGGSSAPHAVQVPNGLYASSGTSTPGVSIAPQEIYNGGYTNAKDVRLRIANGGAGQSGLIRAWADAFIRFMVKVRHVQPFLVAWYLGDTTESLGLLAAGSVDVAVTYNEAAEKQSKDSGAAVALVYGFRDHFLLVGPNSNPAKLNEEDDILVMFNKIVSQGNTDIAVPPDPDVRPPTRFLSRYDKSAANIKESQLFITIGQVPWALVYSQWYHQYPRFPLQALEAASLLSEYTLTDRGTWLSSPPSVTSQLEIFKAGTDDADDPLLNPAHVLLGSNADLMNKDIANAFIMWVVSEQGQHVVGHFKKHGEVLYSKAP